MKKAASCSLFSYGDVGGDKLSNNGTLVNLFSKAIHAVPPSDNNFSK